MPMRRCWSRTGGAYAAPDPMARSARVAWADGQKSIREDDKPVRDRKRLVERNPAIVFCHDDMEFSRGEPERRRFFFDQTASLVSVGYIDRLRSYRRVLKARNVALKERSLDVLDILDIQLATYGLLLRDERARLSAAFDQRFAPRYERVSLLGTRVGVSYRPSWKIGESTEEVLARLASARERELILGTTLSGPHRDRYIFVDDRGDFSERASTGQLRLLSLTLRISQAEQYTIASGRSPILLLDDVLLELDPDKRKRFMDNLPVAEQAFFTFLPGEPYGAYATAETHRILDGPWTIFAHVRPPISWAPSCLRRLPPRSRAGPASLASGARQPAPTLLRIHALSMCATASSSSRPSIQAGSSFCR